MENSALSRFQLRLPIPFYLKGQVFEDFELGPVRGKLRRDILNLPNISPAKENLVALQHILTKLGPLDSPPLQVIKRIPVPSVDYIFLVMCARELEGKIEIIRKCDNEFGLGCGGEIQCAVSCADVQMSGETTIEYTDDGRPYAAFDFHDPEQGKQIELRTLIPDLQMQDDFYMKINRLSKDKGDMGNLIFHQIAATMIRYGDKSSLTAEDLDQMSIRTLDLLMAAHNQVKPLQVDTEVELTCDGCGMTTTVPLPLDSWLRPFANRAR